MPAFLLMVESGYGSGTYAPGDTVHIRANLDPQTMVFHHWAGDTSILLDPEEWNTTFILSEHDLTFFAVQSTVDTLTYIYEVIQGVDNPKNVYYLFPKNPVAINGAL
ncbi:MAG: hypothetical protein IIA61_00290 [Candidatus Marinimicrobia bacterium]|nr:hypothetical protein [Candidatus Neomarinimicrobiota bacterium]